MKDKFLRAIADSNKPVRYWDLWKDLGVEQDDLYLLLYEPIVAPLIESGAIKVAEDDDFFECYSFTLIGAAKYRKGLL